MTVTAQLALTARELDFLWSHLDLGRLPYPLDVPSQGVTEEERTVLRARTFAGLRDRGLLRGERVDADLELLLRVLAAPTAAVDAVGFKDGPLRALAATDGKRGALAMLTDDVLTLTGIRSTSLATSIVGVLPPGDAGPGLAISLPQQLLRKAVDGDEDDPFGDSEERDVLMAGGMSDDDATSLIELADRRIGGGQFGVTTAGRATAVRAGAQNRAKTMITWFDTAEGRYLVVYDGAWVSLAPADGVRIAHRIDELLRRS